MRETPLSREHIAAIRQSCIDAAIDGYQDALLSGLCREGAWEAAVGAIQHLDLEELLRDATASDSPGDPAAATTDRALMRLSTDLARHFSSPGPPAAGSGTAATGAIAAGLLEWAAGHSVKHGAEPFRSRANMIRGRAAALQAALAAAAQRDADIVGFLFDARRRNIPRSALVRAAESTLEIATRCSQVATLAAELAPHAHAVFRPDVDVALRLGWSAGHGALHLFEVNQCPTDDDEGAEWIRNAKRRAWRVRLLLRRAATSIRSSDSDSP